MKRGNEMVSYKPLWETMKEKNITTYTLIYKYNLNPRTINNLKHDRGITVDTLEKLCKILDCTPNDIITFVYNKKVNYKKILYVTKKIELSKYQF